jgi:hypothetical protein
MLCQPLPDIDPLQLLPLHLPEHLMLSLDLSLNVRLLDILNQLDSLSESMHYMGKPTNYTVVGLSIGVRNTSQHSTFLFPSIDAYVMKSVDVAWPALTATTRA